jgi:hypothetical protein
MPEGRIRRTMNITIHGHTIPVTDLQHADRLIDIADRFRSDDDTDGLEKWIYAGCPLDLDAEGGAE